jgi:hypothetical protein
VLHACHGAQLHKTEMEIEYFPAGGKITDFSIRLYDQQYGVSVTRAMKFRGTFTEKDGELLLTKKLNGIIESTRCSEVCSYTPNNTKKRLLKCFLQEKWKKQILFIWTQHEYITDVLRKSWATLPEDLKSNTLIMCACGYDNSRIFFQK